MKNTLVNALKRVGRIQARKFGSLLSISQKESISSIVTEVDLECENEIIHSIKKRFPQHNILGEENGLINHGSDYTWIIDPIDGTSNYAAGVPWFGSLIAVCYRGKPVMAGAYLPIDDKIFFAEDGKGTYINDKKTVLQPVHLSDALVAFSVDYTENKDFLKKGMSLYEYVVKNSRNIRSTNSLVDMMYVVEGKFGGCINLFTKIWDIAAPYLLLKEAGGALKELNGKEIGFDLSEDILNRNYPIIAGSNPLVNLFQGVYNNLYKF
jgi:myo-inositol-1(or 4)-monophosphatase